MRPTPLAPVVLLAVFASACVATTIHVPSQQPTIAAGIAAASPGDTVMIECDTYYEHDLAITSAITLTSETGHPGCVTIDGEAAGRILWIGWEDGAVVSGITFTNGAGAFNAGVSVDSADVVFSDCEFAGNHATAGGGGLGLSKSDPEIVNCNFTGNTAGSSGGGLILDECGGTVIGCNFINNSARLGGGVQVGADCNTEFSTCTFTGNTAIPADISYGAGLNCADGAYPTITWCTFTDNTSSSCGGGIAVDQFCSPVIANCTFDGNDAVWGGGGYVYGMSGGQIRYNTFLENTAQGGGGLVLEEIDNVNVSGCWFEGNNASEAGGGAILEASDIAIYSSTFVRNTAVYGGGLATHACTSPIIAAECTFALNQVTGGRGAGAGIAVSGGSPTEIANSIVAFSPTGEAVACEEGGAVTATACVVYGNAGGDWVACISDQETEHHNAHEDPRFCDMYDDYFVLCENSYCVSTNNPAGGQIGAHGAGCNPCDSPVETTSWGSIKALYR